MFVRLNLMSRWTPNKMNIYLKMLLMLRTLGFRVAPIPSPTC